MSFQKVSLFIAAAFCLSITWKAAAIEPIPQDDSDLDQLIQAVSGALDGCKMGSCPQFTCDDAKAFREGLCNAGKILQGLTPALHDYYLMQMSGVDSLNHESDINDATGNYVRSGYFGSKFFSEVGSVFLSMASFADAFNSWSEFNERLEDLDLDNLTLNSLDTLKGANFSIELLGSSANSLLEGYATIHTQYDNYLQQKGASNNSPLDENTEKIITMASGATDAASAALNFVTQYKLLEAAKNAGQLENMREARDAMRGSFAGAAKALGKVGLLKAEHDRQPMLQKLEELAKSQDALNHAFATNLGNANRTANRIIKIHAVIKKLQTAYEKSRNCLVHCPQPIETKNEMSFTLPMNTNTQPNSQPGAALRSYNQQILTITPVLASQAGKLIANSITPKISVPQPVRADLRTSAKYLIGECKETDKAEIHLVDRNPNHASDTFLANAIAGQENSVEFTTPKYPSPVSYEVQIKNEFSGVLAAAPFNVQNDRRMGQLGQRSFSFDAFYDELQLHFNVQVSPRYEVRPDGSVVIRMNEDGQMNVVQSTIKGTYNPGTAAEREWKSGYAYQKIQTERVTYDDGEVIPLETIPKASAQRLTGVEMTFVIDNGFKRAAGEGVEMQSNGTGRANVKWELDIPLYTP